MQHPASPIRVPSLIKRNTALFALSQSFTGPGMQFAYGLGPLMVLAVTDSPSLSGLSVAILGISRFLVSYPIGRITDRYGRKPGIQLGLAMALVGTFILAFSVSAGSLAIFIAGMMVFGMGMNASLQLRVAATDMFPPAMRAQALGYVALGSLAGLAISPLMVHGAEALALRFGQHPLAVPWLLMPALILIGMAMIGTVRPDPKEIGENLERYYPGYRRDAGGGLRGEKFTAARLLRDKPVRTAIILNCAATGNMAVNMVLTSLMLHEHGHGLVAIAVSQMLHTGGMFGLTVPLGWLADRAGREIVTWGGVVAATIGAVFTTFIPEYWGVTLGTFLVGLGWAGANVGAAALIADRTETAQRGRAIGINESFAGAMSVVIAMVTGPLIAWTSLETAGLMGIAVTLLPLLMLPVRWLGRRAKARTP